MLLKDGVIIKFVDSIVNRVRDKQACTSRGNYDKMRGPGLFIYRLIF